MAYLDGASSGKLSSGELNLDAYGPNPKHQEVVALEREVADWLICDYEVIEPSEDS